jgi:hypothetical protein
MVKTFEGLQLLQGLQFPAGFLVILRNPSSCLLIIITVMNLATQVILDTLRDSFLQLLIEEILLGVVLLFRIKCF